MSTIIIATGLAAILAVILYSMIKDKKKGKSVFTCSGCSGCSGGCGSCGEAVHEILEKK